MYYAGRWEREFSGGQSNIPHPREPTWLICLVLLIGPLFGAIISVVIAIHVQNMDVYLGYLK
jgi:hypothetical protein